MSGWRWQGEFARAAADFAFSVLPEETSEHRVRMAFALSRREAAMANSSWMLDVDTSPVGSVNKAGERGCL